MGLIPDTIIDQILLRADIVEIIREVVPLKRAGRLWRGLCPFHQDADPSFTVYPDKQIFKCFGCKVGGNVFGFLMQYHHMDFPEAVRHLGGRYGIEVPETQGYSGSTNKREKLFEVNELAAKFYKDQWKNLPDDAPAKTYLLQKRKLTQESIGHFELGFAPDSWEGLLAELKKAKVSQELMAELGLVIRSDRGRGFYDRFRNRVMFTFRSTAGKVIGFSGRLMEDGEPKYMNSPESIVFKKGSQFFGLNLAGREISKKDRAIVCEGNFDLVLLHQNGYTESIAVLGSALTEKHVRLLERYTKNIYLLFDGDNAGMKAMWRSLELFFPSNIHPRVVLLPDGEDPDSFLNKNGTEALEKLIEKAPLAMDFAIESKLANAGDDLEGKTQALNELSSLLGLIADPIRQDQCIRQVAEKAKISEGALRKKLATSRGRPVQRPTKQKELVEKPQSFPDAMSTLLAVVFLRPEFAKKAVLEDLGQDLPENDETRLFLELIETCAESSEGQTAQPSKFLSMIENSELSANVTSQIISNEELSEKDIVGKYEDSIRKTRLYGFDYHIGKRIREIEVEVKNVTDPKEKAKLLKEKVELMQERSNSLGDFYESKY